jgi:REP element-mobilizing transposase RayT
MIIASHLVWHGYGHWFPNDLRGSGSKEIREENFEPLGDIHFGRSYPQPPRKELKKFWRAAEPLLKHELLWFDDAIRKIIEESFAQVVAERGYTCWACAILKNHGHGVVRRHRDDPETIWGAFAEGSRIALREVGIVGPDHPVWSLRPYKVYLNKPSDVVDRIRYVQDNFEKEGLPKQVYSFVKAYDGWDNRTIIVPKKRMDR